MEKNIQNHYSALIYIIDHFPQERVKFVKRALMFFSILFIGVVFREMWYLKKSSSESYFVFAFLFCLVLWFLMEAMTVKAEEKKIEWDNIEIILDSIEWIGSLTRKEVLDSVRWIFQEKYPNNKHIDVKIRGILRKMVKEGILKECEGKYTIK